MKFSLFCEQTRKLFETFLNPPPNEEFRRIKKRNVDSRRSLPSEPRIFSTDSKRRRRASAILYKSSVMRRSWNALHSHPNSGLNHLTRNQLNAFVRSNGVRASTPSYSSMASSVNGDRTPNTPFFKLDSPVKGLDILKEEGDNIETRKFREVLVDDEGRRHERLVTTTNCRTVTPLLPDKTCEKTDVKSSPFKANEVMNNDGKSVGVTVSDSVASSVTLSASPTPSFTSSSSSCSSSDTTLLSPYHPIKNKTTTTIAVEDNQVMSSSPLSWNEKAMTTTRKSIKTINLQESREDGIRETLQQLGFISPSNHANHKSSHTKQTTVLSNNNPRVTDDVRVDEELTKLSLRRQQVLKTCSGDDIDAGISSDSSSSSAVSSLTCPSLTTSGHWQRISDIANQNETNLHALKRINDSLNQRQVISPYNSSYTLQPESHWSRASSQKSDVINSSNDNGRGHLINEKEVDISERLHLEPQAESQDKIVKVTVTENIIPKKSGILKRTKPPKLCPQLKFNHLEEPDIIIEESMSELTVQTNNSNQEKHEKVSPNGSYNTDSSGCSSSSPSSSPATVILKTTTGILKDKGQTDQQEDSTWNAREINPPSTPTPSTTSTVVSIPKKVHFAETAFHYHDDEVSCFDVPSSPPPVHLVTARIQSSPSIPSLHNKYLRPSIESNQTCFPSPGLETNKSDHSHPTPTLHPTLHPTKSHPQSKSLSSHRNQGTKLDNHDGESKGGSTRSVAEDALKKNSLSSSRDVSLTRSSQQDLNKDDQELTQQKIFSSSIFIENPSKHRIQSRKEQSFRRVYSCQRHQTAKKAGQESSRSEQQEHHSSRGVNCVIHTAV